MEYYERHFLRYLEADPETREASKKHWIKIHAENVKSGREDLIIFSAKMLASIVLADEFIKEGKPNDERIYTR